MSDGFDGIDELFGGFIEFIGDLILNDSIEKVAPAASSLTAAPVGVEQPHPGYPAGSRFRVRGNEWWDRVTVEDVLTVKNSTRHEVLFSRPDQTTFVVPIGMIDDFEEIPDDSSAIQEVHAALPDCNASERRD